MMVPIWGYTKAHVGYYKMLYGEDWPRSAQYDQPGRFDTCHFCDCSCYMCSYWKYDRDEQKRRDRWEIESWGDAGAVTGPVATG